MNLLIWEPFRPSHIILHWQYLDIVLGINLIITICLISVILLTPYWESSLYCSVTSFQWHGWQTPYSKQKVSRLLLHISLSITDGHVTHVLVFLTLLTPWNMQKLLLPHIRLPYPFAWLLSPHAWWGWFWLSHRCQSGFRQWCFQALLCGKSFWVNVLFFKWWGKRRKK